MARGVGPPPSHVMQATPWTPRWACCTTELHSRVCSLLMLACAVSVQWLVTHKMAECKLQHFMSVVCLHIS
jgi:hypothetical protein